MHPGNPLASLRLLPALTIFAPNNSESDSSPDGDRFRSNLGRYGRSGLEGRFRKIFGAHIHRQLTQRDLRGAFPRPRFSKILVSRGGKVCAVGTQDPFRNVRAASRLARCIESQIAPRRPSRFYSGAFPAAVQLGSRCTCTRSRALPGSSYISTTIFF